MKAPTLDELKTKRYGYFSRKDNGRAYIPERCCEQVIGDWMFSQCSRKNGHGINALFCKQHAKKYEE